MTLDAQSLLKTQVRRNFSCHAGEYERYAQVQKWVAHKLLACMPDLPTGARVLEIGCGTGLLSRLFAQKFPQARLVLSDLAHGMSCRVAQQFPGVPVADADATQLPFTSAAFDLVLSSSVYQWVDDLPQAFAELHRVLRPGGQVVMALFGEGTLRELRASHAAALGGRSSHAQSFPSREQLAAAPGAGFCVKWLESQIEQEWHADVPQLLKGLKAIGAQNASRARPAGLASRQAMEDMFNFYRRHFAVDGRIPASYEVLYLGAQRLPKGGIYFSAGSESTLSVSNRVPTILRASGLVT